jgi:hypothetical protein
MFFKDLPEEIILKIFNLTSQDDQKRLAQVSEQFKRITMESLKTKIYLVGDACLVTKKNKDHKESQNPFHKYYTNTLYVTKNRKKVFNSDMLISNKFFDEITETMKNGTRALIEKLRESGGTACLNADVLEIEFVKENQTTQADSLTLTK